MEKKNRIDLLHEWKREEENAEGAGSAVRFIFPKPEGAGVRPYGFDVINDGAADVMGWYGLRLCLSAGKANTRITVRAGFAGGESLEADFYLAEAGEHSCDVALEDFNVERARANVWRELVSLEVISAEAWPEEARLAGNLTLEGQSEEARLVKDLSDEEIAGEAQSGECLAAGKGSVPFVKILSAELLRGSRIALEPDILGKSGEMGETIRYTVTVHNCQNRRQCVKVSQAVAGWESMYAEIEPASLCLEPYGSSRMEISVRIHDYMPPGAHEKTTVRFLPEGDASGAQELSFQTLRALRHPYIYHTEEKWREVAENIRSNPVFEPGFEKLRRDADGWEAPPLVPFGERDYCCDTYQEHFIMSCAYLYSITKRKEYAEKIAGFFRAFADPETGYPVRKKGCSQSYVQEGHFFQHLALAYDMIYEAGVLSREEHAGIQRCLRIYMEILDRHIRSGHISNWTLSELTGAVYCAMVLQDFERMERFLFGPCGSFEQLSHGAFSDGWWYECSVGYNIWVSSMFLHTAHALLPFGINLIHYHFPLFYGKEVDSINRGQKREIRHGMYNEKWGGIRKNYICIKDLFDAVVPFLDYRGVLFGINDSDEKKIEGVHFGSTFDLAYTHYRDPAYIPIIQRFDTVDPVFGHGELAENIVSHGYNAAEVTASGQNEPAVPDQGHGFSESALAGQEAAMEDGAGTNLQPRAAAMPEYGNACADNIGIAMLRSRKEGCPPEEQIQAVLRYGSHGYAHGHFDRTELLSVMRNGRSFFNPEHVWWGYGHFMYKFYVQNSNTKNMVVTDGKMQIPADARRVLFYSGEKLQAAGVRTTARWGYPPYGGMIYERGQSLQERCEYNASDLPCYDAAPYGEITDLTEPITQTRVMAVLDDCIVIFDSMKGEREHRYESLLQIKGFRSLMAVGGEACAAAEETGVPEAVREGGLSGTAEQKDSPGAGREERASDTAEQKGSTGAAREKSPFETVGEEGDMETARQKKLLKYEGHTGKKSEEPRSDEQFITDCRWYRAKGATRASFETKYGEGEDLRGTRSRYNEPGSLHMDVYTAWPPETIQCTGLAAEDLGQKYPYEFRLWDEESCLEHFCVNPWLLGARKLDVALRPESRTLKLEFISKPLYSEQRYPHDSGQCLFLGNARVELENGETIPLSELRGNQQNIDPGKGTGRDYEGGRVLIEGTEYPDAIPVSALDHSRESFLEYDLAGLRAVRLTGVIGVDNFPGEEGQRRVTYGVSQRAVHGRFITVIEPYGGRKRLSYVEGLSQDAVRIRYEDGSLQEISVRDIDGEPRVELCTCREDGWITEMS